MMTQALVLLTAWPSLTNQESAHQDIELLLTASDITLYYLLSFSNGNSCG